MSEWKEIELGKCVNMISGGTPSKDNNDYWNGDISWASAKDLKSFLLHDTEDYITKIGSQNGTKIPPKGSILILVRGMTLHNDFPICCITKDMAFNQDIKAVIPDNSLIDIEYLAYWMLSYKYHLMSLVESASHGTGRINTNVLKSIKVTCPELKEQKSIAQILGNFDRKIDNLRRQNETLEEIARSIFKHWFIDFEFPNPDGKPYKSSGGAMVRSELGDIPEGWRIRTLGDVATNNSETHKFEDKNKIIFINTGDVLDGKFLHENYMSVNTLPGQAKKRIAKDDILYSEIRPKNKHFAYINFERNIENYVVSTKFMVIRANDSILPRLLYLILKRQESIDEFNYIAESRSGTFPQITFEAVSHFQFPLPPVDTQKYLMPIFINLMEKKEFNVIKIETLTKTRDALLPKLMSGQLRVNE